MMCFIPINNNRAKCCCIVKYLPLAINRHVQFHLFAPVKFGWDKIWRLLRHGKKLISDEKNNLLSVQFSDDAVWWSSTRRVWTPFLFRTGYGNCCEIILCKQSMIENIYGASLWFVEFETKLCTESTIVMIFSGLSFYQ
jgi:hypothetical protein